MLRRTSLFPASLVLLAVILLAWRPAEVPPLFFDEGWNLMVARNWVEAGHYGPMLKGRPVPPYMISTGFPAIAPLALSLRAFGIGLWQARLPGIFFSAGALLLLCWIAARLFGRSAATGTMAVLLLMPIHPDLHPILAGRQALGEMMAVFYILAGYGCFLAGRNRPWIVLLSCAWWGLALSTKPQVIPFMLLALLVPLAAALHKREWRAASTIFAGLAGTLAAFALLTLVQKHLFRDSMPPQTHIADWYRGAVVVLNAPARLAVLVWTLKFALPTLLGLTYALVRQARSYRVTSCTDAAALVRLSLFVLCSSWFAWWASLSIGFMRYLFPVSVIGSIFVSAMLSSLTRNFSPRPLGFNRRAAATLLSVALIAFAVPLTVRGLVEFYTSDDGTAVAQTAAFLNTRTPEGAVIGSGEVELFFLLNRPCLFDLGKPPVKVPATGELDYAVIGPMVRSTTGDAGIPQSRGFVHVASFGRYDIYRRTP